MTITTTFRLRRGLPRVPQGEPWPPGDSPSFDSALVETAPGASVTVSPAPEDAPGPVPETTPAVSSPLKDIQLRHGLPRTPGGKPWPPKNAAPKGPTPVAAVVAISSPVTTPQSDTVDPISSPASSQTSSPTEAIALRQGLPRVPGQGPWPATAEVNITVPTIGAPIEPTNTSEPTETPPAPATAATTATIGTAPKAEGIDKPESKRYGPFTLAQWVGGGVVGVLSIMALAAIVVIGVRWFLNTETGGNLLVAYPGEAPMPDSAPVGFPAWLAWSHFFNLFLLVLIIRSGLQIRAERRPPAYWSPRKNPSRKISLTIWFHQSLDLMWVINGALFIVLLVSTGQWMRIVPTSWEVFPNALSAGLQYLSLSWPTENGWVHYNGLQQLAYFTTVFIAAPLAVATGIRMSGLWPTKMKRLTALYPVELARALHFPVMLYFVFFIFTHVLLVVATGALRNLNHMFAAQGSTDPAVYADNWTGFWLLVLALVAIAAAWVAARPMLLAPFAKLFGQVTNR